MARRRFITEEYAVKMRYVREILQEFGLREDEVHEAFASQANHRLGSYWTKDDNSFQKVWSNLQVWINPPFTLMDKVVLKLLSDEVQCAVVVAPVWRSQMWWPVLNQLGERFIDYNTGCHFFEVFDEKDNQMKDAGTLRWPVRVFLVNYNHYRWKIWEDGDEMPGKWTRSAARRARRRRREAQD